MNFFKLSVAMLLCFAVTNGYSDDNGSESNSSESSNDSSSSSSDEGSSAAETIFQIASDPGASAGGYR